MQERCKICSGDHPRSWDFKRTFLSGLLRLWCHHCNSTRNWFLCFLKGWWIVFASKHCEPTKGLVTFLSSHELLQYFFKTIFHFLIMIDVIVSQAWRFVFFDLLDKITYRVRFQHSIFSSFILISSFPCNLWHKEPDLKYKAVCWEYNVTLTTQ